MWQLLYHIYSVIIMSTKTYRIASIPGDGIGIEVVAAAIEVLKTVAKNNFELSITNFPWGTAFYKETGSYLPSDFLTTL